MESALFLGGASGMAQAGLILPVSHNCDAGFFYAGLSGCPGEIIL